MYTSVIGVIFPSLLPNKFIITKMEERDNGNELFLPLLQQIQEH
jgi:hypothetical protein